MFNLRIFLTLLITVILSGFFGLFGYNVDSQKINRENYVVDKSVVKEEIVEEEPLVVPAFTRETKKNTADFTFKGIDYYPFPLGYETGEAFGSLEKLLKMEEINYVQLRFFLYQDDLNSSLVSFDEGQDYNLQDMIRRIHKAGKKVSLLPHLVVGEFGNHYVANLEPKQLELWFSSYRESLIHYAVLAQESEVELFSLGNELYSLWGYQEEWEETVARVKENYNGLITTKLNCWWRDISFEKLITWDWLAEIDYIGLAPYYDLARNNNFSLEELRASWRNTRHGLDIVWELEEISKKFKSKIVFLEIGYRSIDGSTMEPWNYDAVVPQGGSGTGLFDSEEQSLATQALFDVFSDKDWWSGAFWFYWPTDKPDGQDKTWAIWGKPVESIIRFNFQ
jgi:hypothetical protein